MAKLEQAELYSLTIKKALAKEITQKVAAEKLGISETNC